MSLRGKSQNPLIPVVLRMLGPRQYFYLLVVAVHKSSEDYLSQIIQHILTHLRPCMIIGR